LLPREFESHPFRHFALKSLEFWHFHELYPSWYPSSQNRLLIIETTISFVERAQVPDDLARLLWDEHG
jgi:hypothetical protein